MLEDQLIRTAIKGNAEAIVAVLQHYKAPLYRVAYSYLRNEHDAIEAVQELSYRCFRSIHTVKEPRYIGTWLTRMMMNICRDVLRKKKRELPSEGEIYEQLAYEQAAYEQPLDVEWLDSLSTLDEQQRELIYMKYVEDRTNASIAKQLKLPEGTVKSKLHYTLRKLRHLFREEGL